MSEFYVTLGQKYNREEHPVLPGITADHYIVIESTDKDIAYNQTFHLLGDAWAFLYDKDDFDKSYHPAGEYARFCQGL